MVSGMGFKRRRLELLQALEGQLVMLGIASGGRIRLITDVPVELGTIHHDRGGDYVDFRELGPVFAPVQPPVLLDNIFRVTTAEGAVRKF
jgi:hypothetical protein